MIRALLAAAWLAVAAPAPAAAADPAAVPDTTLPGYLQTLADSTTVYFGPVAAPPDTAGLDSARAYALANPTRWEHFERRRYAFFPLLNFNRVDGPVMGGGGTFGRADKLGQLEGRLATATGPNIALGRLSYLLHVKRGEAFWIFRVMGSRRTMVMDREESDLALPSLRAFLNGRDGENYLQRDGTEARLAREGRSHRLGVVYRDVLESARTTTASWNLFDKPLLAPGNLAATRGHVHDFEYEFLWRVPRTPVIAQLIHATSGGAIGSDLEYRRTLFAAGADVGLGRSFSWLPQLEYGALTGQEPPQASFFLGGPLTLRSLPSDVYGGSRIAFARSEVFFLRDIFGFAHRDGASALPIQAGAFIAAGAAWGADPFGGPARPGVDWPDAEEWKSEVGVSLLYQPGIPDPTDFVRISVGWVLGPGSGDRVSVSFGRALDLLRPFERP